MFWRALDNASFDGFRRFYDDGEPPAQTRLPFFRYEWRQRGNCLPLKLIAQLPPPVATLQANSAVPNWVFTHCREELRSLARWRRDAGVADADAPLPWVQHKTAT